MTRKWLSVELNPGSESELFRRFLKEKEIVYEACAAFNLTHFSCLMNDDEAQMASEVLSLMG